MEQSSRSEAMAATPPATATQAATPTSRPPKARRGRPSGGRTVVPLLIATVLAVGLQQLMGPVVPEDAYLYRLFRPAGSWIMGVVPGLIAFALFWTLADLALKLWTGRVNEHDLERPEIRQIPRLVAQEDMVDTLGRVRSGDRALLTRPVGRRVVWLLHHLEKTDAQRAHEILRHQSDLDADSAAASYRTVKLFIWAMPILGFIGTVLGISLAVGGFSEFLTTSVSIDEIDSVTAELGEVASGLSFAFDTTLLGLLAGLVASVASSGVQAREERMLTRLDELGLTIMANAKGLGEPSARHRSAGPANEVDEFLQLRLEDLTRQMDQFRRAVRMNLDGFLEEWSKLPPEVEKVVADLTGVRLHLGSAAKSSDQLVSEIRALLDGLQEVSSRLNSGLSSSIGSVHDTLEGLDGNLQGVSDTLTRSMVGMEEANQRLAATMASLAPVLAQLAGPMELRLMPANRGASAPDSDS